MTALVPASSGLPAVQASIEAFRKTALEAIAAGFANKGTRQGYVSDLKAWLMFCRQYGVNPWTASPVIAGTFREWRLSTCASKTARRSMQALYSVYGRLQATNQQLGNPFDPKVTGWPPDKGEAHAAISEADAQKMLAACVDERAVRDRALLLLLWSTGCRLQFAAELQRRHWKLREDGEAEATSSWKGGTLRTIRVPTDAAFAVEVWLREGTTPLVFGLGRHAVYDVVKRRARQAGVDPATIKPHGFRAGFATRSYDAQVPEVSIQAAMGHANAEDTRKYDRGARGAVASRLVGRAPGSR